MTTVRIAHAEPLPDAIHIARVLVVLADDQKGRALPLWLMGTRSHSLQALLAADQDGTAPAGLLRIERTARDRDRRAPRWPASPGTTGPTAKRSWRLTWPSAWPTTA